MKDKIIKQFNLPSYIKGKSFAEASKAIDKKFKDRNDKFSNETKEALLKRLAEAQEHLKQAEAPTVSNEYNDGGELDVTGKAAPGAGAYIGAASTAMDFGNQLFGKQNVDVNTEKSNGAMSGASGALKGASAGMAFGPWGAAAGAVIGGAAGVIGSSKQNKAIDRAQATEAYKNYNMAMNTYALGGPIDPTDPKKSKLIHLPEDPEKLAHYQKRKKLTDDQLEGFQAQKMSDEDWRNKRDSYYSEQFKSWKQGKTGNTPNEKFTQIDPEYRQFWETTKNSWHKENPRGINDTVMSYRETGGLADGQGVTMQPNQRSLPIAKGNNLDQNQMALGGELEPVGLSPLDVNLDITTPGFNPNMKRSSTQYAVADAMAKKDNFANRSLDWLDQNKGDILRYAPVVANAAQLASIDKPMPVNLERMDNRYQPQYVDEAAMQNTIANNFNDSYVTETSGGSIGAVRNNARAAQLAKTMATSDAYGKASAQNRNEDKVAQQFNAGIDRTNLTQSNREQQINARNEGAYNTEKSKLIGQLGTDIGNIGKEEKYKQMVKDSGICYDSRGAYICGSKDRLSEKEIEEINNTNSNAYGGAVDTNKLFSSYYETMLNKNK